MWRMAGVGALAALAISAAPASAEPLVGIVGGKGAAVVSFDSARPTVWNSIYPINGLVGGVNEELVGIDFRANPIGVANPDAAKQLYAVTAVDGGALDTLRVYTVDPGSGNAKLVGNPVMVTGGDAYGIDFNHTVDRIRVVNDGDENARLNPNDGSRADAPTADTDLSPAGRGVTAVAYDRVDTDPATGTTLYGLSTNPSQLVTIGGLNSTPSPNGGVINVLGATTLTAFGGTETSNFDISPSGAGFATALANPIGIPALFRVDLSSGVLTNLGRTPTSLRGLASVPSATVSFDPASYTRTESDGFATITLSRTGNTARTTTVTYSASDGSAAGSVIFVPGETSKPIAIPIASDAVDNPDRVVTISVAATDALTTTGPAATLKITDDDDPTPAPTPTPTPTPTPAPLDRTPPAVKITTSVARSVVKVTAKPNEPARLDFTLANTRGVTLVKKSLPLAAGSRSVSLDPGRRAHGKLKLRVVATDAAGNRSVSNVRVRLST
jgi:hypothetical protein